MFAITKNHFLSIKKQFEENDNLQYEINDDDIIAKKNDKFVFRSKYEHVGILNTKTSFWYWAWSSPFKSISSFTHSLKTKKYINDKQIKMSDEDADYYTFLVNNNSFYCTQDDFFKLILIVLFTNKTCWFAYINDQHRIHIYLLTDFIQM